MVCSSQYDPRAGVRALMCGVPRAIRGKRLTMLLKCFADDSGNSEQKGIPDRGLFVLAGYLMSEQRWEDFAERWYAQLKRDHPIDYFHMADAESGTGEFVGMREEFRRRKVKDLALVIRECNPVAIACQTTWKDYSEIVRGNVPEKMDSPYPILFFQLMKLVADMQLEFNALRDFGYLPPEYVFDEQGAVGLKALSWYGPLADKVPEPYRTMMSNTPIFKNDKDVMPLQAADMLAWHLRRMHQFPEEERATLALMTDPEEGIMVRIIDPKALRQYVELTKRVDPKSI